ncbi:MAG: DNA repair protein RecN [Candidatus Omnitrophota bacterium]
MLSQFTIQNFGLINRLEVEFCNRLNVFTGETGAGKSILIDALRYALGERLNTTFIRDTDKTCVVEAVFEISDEMLARCPFVSEYLSGDDPVLIINRSYSTDGRNKIKINGFTVTVAQLKELGDHLVDFHGPHDHQMLFSEDSHINILDRLAEVQKEKSDYLKEYEKYAALQKKLKNLQSLAESSEREMDTLSHQIKELEQVPLEVSEYEEISRESTRINNSEKLFECVKQLVDILENDQTGVSNAVSQAFGPMSTLNGIDESTSELANILSRIQEDSSELITALNGYLDNLSFDQNEASDINRRCDIYYEIIRKYGPTLEDAKKFYESSREKHDLLVDLEHNDTELRKNIASSENDLKKSAKRITEKRKKRGKALEQTIENELKELGIKHVKFECRIERSDITVTGCDKITFYISPNAGEDLKPLAEIVSSGEAARVMLALKKALTKVDPIPVLIFDEIDAQIGGRLGAITGKKLKELSQDRQVLLITHLPQIASFGDRHFKVLKMVENKRTITNVIPLEEDNRIKELANMMSGEMETLIAIEHAHDMLSRAKK